MQTVHHNHLMQTVRFLLIGVLLPILSLNLLSCNAIEPATPSFYEIVGTQPERSLAMTEMMKTMLANHQQPLSPIIDAYYIEEKLGDDRMGPADYRSFYRIEVSPSEVGRWQELVPPLDAVPHYQAPAHASEWWISEEAFAALEFYKADQFTGRSNSWMGISPKEGSIFIYSFTT